MPPVRGPCLLFAGGVSPPPLSSSAGRGPFFCVGLAPLYVGEAPYIRGRSPYYTWARPPLHVGEAPLYQYAARSPYVRGRSPYTWAVAPPCTRAQSPIRRGPSPLPRVGIYDRGLGPPPSLRGRGPCSPAVRTSISASLAESTFAEGRVTLPSWPLAARVHYHDRTGITRSKAGVHVRCYRRSPRGRVA